MSERLVSRRDVLGFIFKAGVAATAVTFGMKSIAELGSQVIDNLADERSDLPDYLLRKSVVSDDSEVARLYWGRIYTVRNGDTISHIAANVYPDFDNNQPFYTDKLRLANMQNKIKNALIYPGQSLYIPNPGVPVLGFAAGEERFLRGKTENGVYRSTKITEINPKDNRLVVSYCEGFIETSLNIGVQFGTDRSLQIVAVLKEIPGLVPARVVFELV